MFTSQLFRCMAVLIFLIALATCSSADDRVECFLQSVEQNRSARMVFDYEFRRDSPLLERPLTSATQREFEIRDSVGRAVTLRPVPKGIDWNNSRPQLGEQPAPGEGLFFRTEILRRRSKLLFVNAIVSTNDPTSVNRGSRLSVRLRDPTLSAAGENLRSLEEQKSEFLRYAPYNYALGVVLGRPIEDYVGNASDRTVVHTSDELSCASETRFGRCKLHWSNSTALYPDRVTVHVSGDDITLDTPLSQVSMNGGKGWPSGGLLSVNVEISEINTETFGQNVVPVAWTTKESYRCADGSTVVQTCKIQLLDFSLDADRPSGIHPKVVLPIGHKVSVEGKPELEYAWDGKWAAPLDIDWRKEIP